MDHFVWVAYGAEHAQLALHSIATVNKHYPQSVKWLVTDCQVAEDSGPDYIIMSDMSVPLMQKMTASQAAILANSRIAEGEEVCFLDNDAFLLKRFDFELAGDIGVTWRDNMGNTSMLMPYNYGVLFAKKSYNSVAAWFWMCEHIGHQARKSKDWYGNQVALRELCGPINYEDHTVTRGHDYFSVKVQHFPCAEYNWTPDSIEDSDGKFVVHCKGNRKDLLKHYYEQIMGAA